MRLVTDFTCFSRYRFHVLALPISRARVTDFTWIISANLALALASPWLEGALPISRG